MSSNLGDLLSVTLSKHLSALSFGLLSLTWGSAMALNVFLRVTLKDAVEREHSAGRLAQGRCPVFGSCCCPEDGGTVFVVCLGVQGDLYSFHLISQSGQGWGLWQGGDGGRGGHKCQPC